MSDEGYGATVAKRRLSHRLAMLRKRSGHTANHVCDMLNWGRGKVGRFEANQWKRPEMSDVRDLLRLYGVDGAEAEEIVDTKPGYVYDSTRQNPPNPSWGLLPAGGKAEVYVYPDCKDGMVVADVVRIDKGHTEGLEPKITEELVKLMLSAKGGKIQQAH